jgi:hypothetical protein
MEVKDLRQIINQLPASCDGYRVEFVAQVSPTGDQREDHPIFGSFLDVANREFLLARREQTEKLQSLC